MDRSSCPIVLLLILTQNNIGLRQLDFPNNVLACIVWYWLANGQVWIIVGLVVPFSSLFWVPLRSLIALKTFAAFLALIQIWREMKWVLFKILGFLGQGTLSLKLVRLVVNPELAASAELTQSKCCTTNYILQFPLLLLSHFVSGRWPVQARFSLSIPIPHPLLCRTCMLVHIHLTFFQQTWLPLPWGINCCPCVPTLSVSEKSTADKSRWRIIKSIENGSGHPMSHFSTVEHWKDNSIFLCPEKNCCTLNELSKISYGTMFFFSLLNRAFLY